MTASQSIKQYYFENSAILPNDKKFHLASRLASWDNDQEAYKLLQNLRGYMLPNEDSTQAIKEIIKIKTPIIKPYGYDLRKRYFDKYPNLFSIHNAFFRVRHLKEIYGVDSRDILLQTVNQPEVKYVYDSLCNDLEAIKILSRFAVDYIYLYEFLFDDSNRFDPQNIYELKDYYDSADITHLHLLISLFTHSIIAETNFYIKQVPTERLEVYRAMLNELESLIRTSKNIKLDNLFEFLVTCRICGLDTEMSKEIWLKGENSMSPTGTYIIDPLNGSADTRLNSFAGSEHRNVLFIMSHSAYKPKPSLVK